MAFRQWIAAGLMALTVGGTSPSVSSAAAERPTEPKALDNVPVDVATVFWSTDDEGCSINVLFPPIKTGRQPTQVLTRVWLLKADGGVIRAFTPSFPLHNTLLDQTADAEVYLFPRSCRTAVAVVLDIGGYFFVEGLMPSK